MKPTQLIPQFMASAAACAGFLFLLIAVPSMAGGLELSLDVATGGQGKFAAAEIRREAAAKGMTSGEDANATRISITVEKDAKAAAQGYRIRVQNEGGRRVINVSGADATGAMYGGLDIAEAIRTGTLAAHREARNQVQHPARSAHAKLHGPLRFRPGEYPRGMGKGFLDRLSQLDGAPSLQRAFALESPSIPVAGESSGVSRSCAERCLAHPRQVG
jgi:hypothetical protein